MTQILMIFIFIILFFLFLGTASSSQSSTIKDATKKYLSEFKIYLCIKNKLILYPPHELFINNTYYTLNLSTNSKLLNHKCINAQQFSPNSRTCTECMQHCPLGSDDIVNLEISFEQFRKMNDLEFKNYLKSFLSPEQYNELFDIEK